MQASDKELELLEQLQKVDRDRVSAQKKFDELPHRKAILDVRKKKAEVQGKRDQVQGLLDATEKNLHNLMHEDERLAAKQDEIEQKLQESKGDYRSVTAHTKELDGIVKRRGNVDNELGEVDGKLSKVKATLDQVDAAIAQLDKRETELTEAFQKVGGALSQAIADMGHVREQLIGKLSPEVRKAYEHAVSQCGGVGLAHLVDEKCDTCRTSFTHGRMSQLKADAPLATCPSCRRLLVVEEG